jgi:predicted GIY-YIG superfamily endonuclease
MSDRTDMIIRCVSYNTGWNYIYILVSLDDKRVYVGLTQNPRERYISHMTCKKMFVSPYVKPHKDVLMLVVDTHADRAVAKEYENLWMREVRSKRPRGYNVQYKDVKPTPKQFCHLKHMKISALRQVLWTVFSNNDDIRSVFNLTFYENSVMEQCQEHPFKYYKDRGLRAVLVLQLLNNRRTRGPRLIVDEPVKPIAPRRNCVEYMNYIRDLLRPIELPIPKNLQPRVKYVLIDDGIYIPTAADTFEDL